MRCLSFRCRQQIIYLKWAVILFQCKTETKRVKAAGGPFAYKNWKNTLTLSFIYFVVSCFHIPVVCVINSLCEMWLNHAWLHKSSCVQHQTQTRDVQFPQMSHPYSFVNFMHHVSFMFVKWSITLTLLTISFSHLSLCVILRRCVCVCTESSTWAYLVVRQGCPSFSDSN